MQVAFKHGSTDPCQERSSWNAMEVPIHYVLIVANRTAAAPALVEHVRRRALRTPCEFTLLAPASREQAKANVATALPLLEDAAGGPVKAIVGPPDPVVAVQRAVADRHFDEILVSTLPEPDSVWLERELPARIQRPWLPVGVVTAER
jgi:hypothetical protein